jgi:hypothetical protein
MAVYAKARAVYCAHHRHCPNGSDKASYMLALFLGWVTKRTQANNIIRDKVVLNILEIGYPLPHQQPFKIRTIPIEHIKIHIGINTIYPALFVVLPKQPVALNAGLVSHQIMRHP